VFWGLVAAVVVYAIRATSRGREGAGSPPRRDDAALRILDERFARGDIDAEEYTQRRDLLRTR
jgi:putative membrane protein